MKENQPRKRNRVSLTKCDEPFDNTLHSILTLYVLVSEAIENHLVDAEVAPEEEDASAPEDVEDEAANKELTIPLASDNMAEEENLIEAVVGPEGEADTPEAAEEVAVVEASALDSADESVVLAEDVNVDIDDAVEAEVALEAEADTPDDAADEYIIEESTIEDSALESAGDLIPLAEDDNLDIGDADVIDAEVAPEAEADTPDDVADEGIIEDAALESGDGSIEDIVLESAEDLIPLAEDDDVDIHNLVEAEEEGNIAFGAATIAATAVGLTAAGAVVIGARASAEDDVEAEAEADTPDDAADVAIVEASVLDFAGDSILVGEDDNDADVVIDTEVLPEAKFDTPDDAAEAIIEDAVPDSADVVKAEDDVVQAEAAPEEEFVTPEDGLVAEEESIIVEGAAAIAPARSGSFLQRSRKGFATFFKRNDTVDAAKNAVVGEEGNIAFGGAGIAATALGLTAAGAVVIGARAAAEDDVDADVAEVAPAVEDDIVETSVPGSAENSIPLAEDNTDVDVVEEEPCEDLEESGK